MLIYILGWGPTVEVSDIYISETWPSSSPLRGSLSTSIWEAEWDRVSLE